MPYKTLFSPTWFMFQCDNEDNAVYILHGSAGGHNSGVTKLSAVEKKF
jgi:hypothetical protein